MVTVLGERLPERFVDDSTPRGSMGELLGRQAISVSIVVNYAITVHPKTYLFRPS
jgi:hypothetical protein